MAMAIRRGAEARRLRRGEKQAARKEAAQHQRPDLTNCESPIERRLLGSLRRALPECTDIRVQVPIGPYRADFLVTVGAMRLVVEADGEAFHSAPEQQERDRRRDAFMAKRGIRVVRFTGSQIMRDTIGCASVVAAIVAGPPLPDPLAREVRKEARKERRMAREQARQVVQRARKAAFMIPFPR